MSDAILAWRVWKIYEGALVSLNGTLWPGGTRLEAECQNPGPWHWVEKTPGEQCQCGIYAAKDLMTLSNMVVFPRGPYVYGRVSLWGKVIEGEMGYRAEFAYPYEIIVPDTWDLSLVETLRKTYQVDVITGEPLVVRESVWRLWSGARTIPNQTTKYIASDPVDKNVLWDVVVLCGTVAVIGMIFWAWVMALT